MSTPVEHQPAEADAQPGGAPAGAGRWPGDGQRAGTDRAEDGRTTIAGKVIIKEAVLAKLAERIVTEVPDAQPIGGWNPRQRGSVRATIDGRIARLRVRLGVRWPASVPGVSIAVRDQLVDRVTQATGLAVETVDIVVADLPAESLNRPRVR